MRLVAIYNLVSLVPVCVLGGLGSVTAVVDDAQLDAACAASTSAGSGPRSLTW